MQPEPRSRLRDAALATILVLSVFPPVMLVLWSLFAAQLGGRGEWAIIPLGLAVIGAGLAAIVRTYRYAREGGAHTLGIVWDVILFAVMPVWGLAMNHTLNGRCVSDCDMGVYRAFAEPWAAAPFALHVCAALAYAVSRRRPARLPAVVEALTLATMFVGALLHVALQVQLGAGFMIMGLILFPFGLPVISPALTVIRLLGELRARLVLRAADDVVAPAAPVDVYREAPVAPPEAPTAMSRPWIVNTLAASPVVAGLWAVASALVAGRNGAAVMAFTETCQHTFSRIPVQMVPRDCHYLCTVAAQGHPWLVRPERMGVRNGQPIVVNRQLAVANAFEDLLHTRWPRFGRLARRTYDRLGLPVIRYIRASWMSDAVYLAMKPAEWIFYAVLLLLDPGDPEARIDRMYRG